MLPPARCNWLTTHSVTTPAPLRRTHPPGLGSRSPATPAALGRAYQPTIPNRVHTRKWGRGISVPRSRRRTRHPGEEGKVLAVQLGPPHQRHIAGHKRTLERLNEQLRHAKQVVAQTRAMIQARHGSHQAGTLTMDPHTFSEDNDDLKQAEGVVQGLTITIAVMEAEAEEARNPTASLRPGPALPPESLSLSASWPGAVSRFKDFFLSGHSHDTAGPRTGGETA